jgi:glycerol kinase
MSKYVAAIDQGTTSTRCILFDRQGTIISVDQREHQQIYPKPGWVEHDAMEIWERTQQVVQGALDQAEASPAQISAIGITNQRETTVVWDKLSGRPIYNAVVWQDMRTDEICARLGKECDRDFFRDKTGLPLATYFSGPKIKWILENVNGAQERAENGELLFGNIDSWIIWKLTGIHVTDVTNASRTLLMNLATLDWDDEILKILKIPYAMLPTIRSSSEIYGSAHGILEGIPVAGDLGDQQAALFGQTCFEPGDAKNTYGTGCFMLMNTGETAVPS